MSDQCYHALMIAGKICFSPRLSPTSLDRRQAEFSLFEPFVGKTKPYQIALEKFKKRNRIGLSKLNDFNEHPNAFKQPYYGIRNYYSRSCRG